MSASRSFYYSQDIDDYRRRYANYLFDKYCNLQKSLTVYMREYNKREKINSTRLKTLNEQYKRFFDRYYAKKSPRNISQNRKYVCERIKLDYNDFCKYVNENNYKQEALYDCVYEYIHNAEMKEKRKFRAYFKNTKFAISKIETNISRISSHIKNDFSAYELCDYLNVDYTELLNIDFSRISAIEAIVELKRENLIFFRIPQYETSLDTLDDLEYGCSMSSCILWEPIRETTIEYLLDRNIDYQTNLDSIRMRYSKYN